MHGIERLRAWWSGGRQADLPANEREIDEELMFHLRSLVEDNLARGLPAETAWQEAQRRFGSLRRYADACRRRTSTGRFGRMIPVPALLLVAVLCGWWLLDAEQKSLARHTSSSEHFLNSKLNFMQGELTRAIDALHAAQVANAAQAQAAESHDLTGQVVDREGKPLADAKLLIILKTWPDGRYRQEPFAATSDAAGQFCLPKLIPADGQFAVQVAALRSGYALASSYQLQEGPGPHAVEPVTLRLTEAAPVTLLVQDCHGRSVAGARVVPASRQSSRGEQHLVYFQGSEPIQTAADAQGHVGAGWFEAGDEAEILVQLPGKDWESHAIRVPTDAGSVTVSARAAADDEQHRPGAAADAPG